MSIEYKVKGVVLNEHDIKDIHSYYEAACTAEYIRETHDMDEERALELGYEVRRLMNKYDYDEGKAISEVLNGEDKYEEDDKE